MRYSYSFSTAVLGNKEFFKPSRNNLLWHGIWKTNENLKASLKVVSNNVSYNDIDAHGLCLYTWEIHGIV